jgi:hypothetical protein
MRWSGPNNNSGRYVESDFVSDAEPEPAIAEGDSPPRGTVCDDRG